MQPLRPRRNSYHNTRGKSCNSIYSSIIEHYKGTFRATSRTRPRSGCDSYCIRIYTVCPRYSILQIMYHSPCTLCDSWKVTFLRRPRDDSTSMSPTSMSPIFSRESEEIRIPRRAASVLLGIRGPSLHSSVPMVTFTRALQTFHLTLYTTH